MEKILIRILIDYLLALGDDELIHDDQTAMKMLESISDQLSELSSQEKEGFIGILYEIADDEEGNWGSNSVEIRKIPAYLGWQEEDL
jgi:hypothetical protein